MSPDGLDWRGAAPDNMIDLFNGNGRIVAGYGPAAYLLGWSPRGLAVWRTEDGSRWETSPLLLDNRAIESPLRLDVTIAAGPHGVLIVGWDTRLPPRFHGFYVWHSPDGRSFPSTGRVPKPPDNLPGHVVAAATPNGFLVGVCDYQRCMVFASEDGLRWQDISAGLPEGLAKIRRISGNASTMVLVREPTEDSEQPSDEPRVWYRRDGTWRPARVDPGRLPDPGVVPVRDQWMSAIQTWGTGFIATGGTYDEFVGVIWYSADGSAWPRMPVRDNEFHLAQRILDVAVSNNKALALGLPVDESGNLLIWQADAPPR